MENRTLNGTSQNDAEEKEEKIVCGIGCCKPRWAARLANPKLFTLCWCLATFSNITVSVYLNGIMTSVEKRFELQSKDLGFLAGAADIGSTAAVLFVTYYGGKPGVNRPRMIGMGVMLLAVGSFLSGFPHFISPAYKVNLQNVTQTKSTAVCLANQTTDDTCNVNSPDTSSANGLSWYMLLVAAQIIYGVGICPIVPLGTTYIDDHVSKSSAPLYVGTSYIAFGLGPSLGFLLSAYAVRRYVDFDKNIDPGTVGLTPNNPLWVGAWWLGFLIGGAFQVFVALPLMLFPAKLKTPPKEDESTAKKARKKMMPDMGMDGGKPLLDPARGLWEQIKEMIHSLKAILTNWTFMCLALSSVCQVSVLGSFTFAPKYLEVQFGIPKSQANFIIGMIALPTTTMGIVFSGLIIKRFKLTPKGGLYMAAAANLIALCGTFPIMFISCPQAPMAGVTVPYGYSPSNLNLAGNLQDGINLIAPCNAACNCPLEKYKPVCGPDGVTYFSGCHAGCTEEQTIRGPGRFSFSNFSNCGCLDSGTQGMGISGGYTTPYEPTVAPSRLKRDVNNTTTTAATVSNSVNSNTSSTDVSSPHNLRETSSTSTAASPTTAESGSFVLSTPCRPTCNKWPIFVGLSIFTSLCRSFVLIPVIIGVLRALTPETKSFGFGVQQLMVRVLGFIPSPVYFGALIDSTCTLWSSICGKRGACLLYNLETNRYVFNGGQIALRFLSTFLILIAAYRFKRQERADGKPKEGATIGELAVSMGSLTASRYSLSASRHSLDQVEGTDKPTMPRDTEDILMGLLKKDKDRESTI